MSAAPGGKFRPGEGDWICPDAKCGNINFSRRTSCNRCGTAQAGASKDDGKDGGTEIGKVMAEKSKGLFSADDWQCKTCGNVNWARRSTCNMCNGPKFGKIEQRTGFGGGYMERDEVVEYVKREDSEDEYDEFGRRKKKFMNKMDEKPTEQPKQVVQADEDEDEEEDDDEDVDLSKYDFDGWGDEDEDEDGKVKKTENSEIKDTKSENLALGSRSPRSAHSRSSSSSGSSSRSSSPGHSPRRNRSRSRSRSSSRSRGPSKRYHRSYSRSRSRSRSPLSRRRSDDSHSEDHHRRRRSRS